MASSVLLSDNGASSGSAGIKSTGGNDGVLLLQTTTSGGTATTAVTLDNNQNMGVGITSIPNYSSNLRTVSFSNTSGVVHDYCVNGTRTGSFVCQSSGFDLTTQTAIPLILSTNATERARITSSGFFKASNTGSYQDSAGSYFEFRSNQNAPVVYITDTIASGFTDTMIQARFTGYTPNSVGAWFLYCNDTTNQKAGILSTGTFESRTSTYGGVSDIKLKQDIVDATSQWDDIKAVRVRKFRFKDEPESALQIGVIAQELEVVSPGLVYETPDSEEVDVVNEDGTTEKKRQATGTTTKSVKYSILYMKAVAALQEAMNRIEQLEADVAALKGAQA